MVRSRHRLAALLAVAALAPLPACRALPTWPGAGRGQLVVELPGASAPAVLYLESLSGESPRPDASRLTEITSEGDSFRPPLTAVRSGDRVRFSNRGAVAHRIFTTSREGRRERLVGAGGRSAPLRIAAAGEHRFYCSLHADESFVIFASPLRHFAIPEGGRTHRMEDVRAGRYRVGWWSEAGVRSLGVVEIRAGETTTHVARAEVEPRSGAEAR